MILNTKEDNEMFDNCEFCGGELKPIKFINHDRVNNLDEFEGECTCCHSLSIVDVDHEYATDYLNCIY